MSAPYDYVIVGGGSAGCVLANRLSADPRCRVLLLEAGGHGRHLFVSMPAGAGMLERGRIANWCFRTEPQAGLDGRSIAYPRGRGLGGSSNINGMIWVRGHPADFDGWAAAGNRGWAWADLVDAFARAEAVLGVGPVRTFSPLGERFLRACEEIGIPRTTTFNNDDPHGAAPYHFNITGGIRNSARRAYLEPARQRANLDVRPDAHVTGIAFEGDRAIGVHVRRGGTSERVLARRDVLLSAGAIQSPQVLLLSGIGQPEQLREHGIDCRVPLANVGENLQDHVGASVMAQIDVRWSLDRFERWDRMLGAGIRWLCTRGGPASVLGIEGAAFVRSGPQAAIPDLQFDFLPAMRVHDARRPDVEAGMLVHACPLRPRSRGRVTLGSADPLAPPRIDPGFLVDDDDARLLARGLLIARQVLAARAFAGTNRGEILPGAQVDTEEALIAYARRRANTVYHPVGTCRMGTDAGAVVDPRLCVNGVQGLRVIDASIMPTLVGANTNAATTAIAECAAARLLEEHA